jgi:hypothetical protein
MDDEINVTPVQLRDMVDSIEYVESFPAGFALAIRRSANRIERQESEIERLRAALQAVTVAQSQMAAQTIAHGALQTPITPHSKPAGKANDN